MSGADLPVQATSFARARWVNPPPILETMQLGGGITLVRIAPDRPDPISWEATFDPSEDHVLVWRRGPRAPVETIIDGRRDAPDPRRMRNGFLIPAGAASRWVARAQRPSAALHVFVPPAHLSALADAEGYPRGAAGPAPRFGLDASAFGPLFDGLFDGWRSATLAPRVLLDHWAMLLAVSLLPRHTPPRGGTFDARSRVRLGEFLEANLHRDIGLAEMAATLGMTPGGFARSFRETAGETPHAHLMALRTARARRLMRDRRLTLADVALLSGFRNAAHLSAMLRRQPKGT